MKFHAADIHVDRVETVEEATVACTWAYDTNEYRRREDDTDVERAERLHRPRGAADEPSSACM